MESFDHILNWKLLPGSHDFPGPDGGTCINEAAIVAAGFEYRAVKSEKDCPPCFSPVLARYLIDINDIAPDLERQQLMQFVLRLSGSVDTAQVENLRVELIRLRTVQTILPLVLDVVGCQDRAAKCRAVKDASEAKQVAAEVGWDARSAAEAAEAAWSDRISEAAAEADWAGLVAKADAGAAARVAEAIRAVQAASKAVEAVRAVLYSRLTAIAAEAFSIGNQAEPIEIAQVADRMGRLKAPAGA